MNVLSKFYSATLDSVNRRVLKIWGMGPATAAEIAPFGDDSNPVQGMDVIYAITTNDDEPVAIGYMNTHQLAGPGEKRFYSIGPDGKTIAFYTWMKSNGTYEIGGVADNLIRYEKLNIALQATVDKLNIELAKIQVGLAAVGGTYAMADVDIDISAAKINEVKCL